MEARDVAVVIPTRDRPHILARTLAALASQTVAGFSIVVALDGGDQDPGPVEHAAPKGTTVVQLARRGGPGAARNAAVAATDRPVVLMLGDDMVPDRDLVAGHVQQHREHSRVEDAVLGHVEWHPEVQRNESVRWIDSSGTQFDYANISGEDAGWGRFYSCNVSLKRDLFLKAGGFDEEFTFDYEDLDFAYRLHQQGLVLWYEPRAVARHLHGYDLEALKRRYASRGSAERLMAGKHPWFTPYFHDRVVEAESHRQVPLWWVLASRAIRLTGAQRQRSVVSRVDRWFNQRLAGEFLAAWEGEDDLADLRAYLGSEFDQNLLWGHRQAVDEEERLSRSEAEFYRTSRMYLYDLTAFAMSGTKRPYLAALRGLLPRGATLLDYGCGIGSDGIRLLQEGYHVDFADFDNPSTEYLRWRLARRGLSGAVFDVASEIQGGYDAVYAFDVVEHVDEPLEFLARLECLGELVAVNFLVPDPADTHLHRPLPVRSLLRHAESKGIVQYRRYHVNSHFVVYRSGGRGGWSSRAQRTAGRLAYRRARLRRHLASFAAGR